MVKPLDQKGEKKWFGYLTELKNDREKKPLTKIQIKYFVEGWRGQTIDPEKKSLTPIIENVEDKFLSLKLKSGKYRTCNYEEIIDAEKVIRYWLSKGLMPEVKDFRYPDPSIDAKIISNNSYAPAIAERIRKQLNNDHILPPEVCILPMSPNEFATEGIKTIKDVQEKFILGILTSEERNGSYLYRHRKLNAPEGSVVLFQFKSNIIASGIFLYSEPFDKPQEGYKGSLVFDIQSIRTFNPMNRKKIRQFWPEFENFNQSYQRLNPSEYLRFVASLNGVSSGSKMNKALALTNWRQGGRYYRLRATSQNQWVGFQESVILKLQAKYQNDFFLVIWNDKDNENDFYNIPFDKVKHLFIDEYKTIGKIRNRWIATIKNHIFMMQGNSRFAIDISEDYGNRHDEFESEYFEGGIKYRFSSYYERDPNLRSAAVKIHGLKCEVCGFDFEATYGSHGNGYIEVHHLKPVSSFGDSNKVNPKNDMAVLCSNCHRMIHRKKGNILTLSELKKILR